MPLLSPSNDIPKDDLPVSHIRPQAYLIRKSLSGLGEVYVSVLKHISNLLFFQNLP